MKQKKQSSVGIAFGKDADLPTFAERYAETEDITFLHFDLWERIQKHYKNYADIKTTKTETPIKRIKKYIHQLWFHQRNLRYRPRTVLCRPHR